MCKAISFSEGLITEINRLKSEFRALHEQQSIFDTTINKIYHEIEFSNMNASQGYNKAKELQDILRKRRKTKLEISKFQVLFNTLKVDDIHKEAKKIKLAVEQTERNHNQKYALPPRKGKVKSIL
jgi:hypothetical protein